MAQIFKPSANSVAKVTLIGVAVVPLTLGVGVAALSRSPANTKVNVPKNQPVPFSHQHHSYELGIDCRYCHTSEEKSWFPGVPPTETCMSCHSQIWTNSPLLEPVRESYETNQPIKWNQLNKLPEFAHFNHSIHINRGVNCNVCHGPVNNMHITWRAREFQMQWCLQCHRNPARYLYRDPKNPQLTPREQVFNLYWKYQEYGSKGLSPVEQQVIAGTFNGEMDKKFVENGQKLVNEYGVKVQQLADCSVCHY